MNKEELIEICKEQFKDNIMNNLDSSLIFAYVQELEKENTNLKQALIDIRDKINSVDLYEKDYWLDSEECDYILQKIDEVLGNDDNVNNRNVENNIPGN